MTYRIRITDAAEHDIDRFIHHVAIVKQEPLNAAHLLEAIDDGIASLASLPHRFAVAPESMAAGRTVRMLFIKRMLLLLFTINEADDVVTVQRFRHGSRQPLEIRELD